MVSKVTDFLSQGIDIHLKWVVKSINYEGLYFSLKFHEHLHRRCCDSNQWERREALCTKSSCNSSFTYSSRAYAFLNVTFFTQIEFIKFTPPLPVPKHVALKNLKVSYFLWIFSKKKMENAIKMVCVFTQRFWPSKLGGIICADTPIPEIWYQADFPH